MKTPWDDLEREIRSHPHQMNQDRIKLRTIANLKEGYLRAKQEDEGLLVACENGLEVLEDRTVNPPVYKQAVREQMREAIAKAKGEQG